MDDPRFVRPYRRRIRHGSCATVTVLSAALAEVLAIRPDAVGELRCTACREHLTASSFRWVEDNGSDGEQVGTWPEGQVETGTGWPGKTLGSDA